MASQLRIAELEEAICLATTQVESLRKELEYERKLEVSPIYPNGRIYRENHSHWCTVQINAVQLKRRLAELLVVLFASVGSSGFPPGQIHTCKECGQMVHERKKS